MTAKPAPFATRQPFRFTRDQYFEMDRRGFFNDKRVELIYGAVVEMSPIHWPHHLGVSLTASALGRVFTTGFFVDTQQTFPVPSEPIGSAPQPDVAVIPGALRDYSDHPTAAVLLVEVADSTLSEDLTTKAELYATANVPEYWVLDIPNRQLHVFRDPQSLHAALGGVAYQTHLTLAPTDTVSPLAAPHASITVNDLLP